LGTISSLHLQSLNPSTRICQKTHLEKSVIWSPSRTLSSRYHSGVRRALIDPQINQQFTYLFECGNSEIADYYGFEPFESNQSAERETLPCVATLECSEARAEAKELGLRESRAVVTCGTSFRTTTAPYLFVCSLARLVSVFTLPPHPINICALETEHILS